MSLAELSVDRADIVAAPNVGVRRPSRALHRLAEVRRIQGLSQRTVARRLRLDMASVKQMEREDTDLPLSALYEWQKALDVPVGELLVEPDEPLSTPVMKRAQLVRLMKTAMAIKERSGQPAIQRLAEVLVNQLIEIMPELAQVTPWHAVGNRRSQSELGQAAIRQISDRMLEELAD
ncbi:MAG: helix-turn-helix transcriptional regulator [Pirellulales bacterium]|jgi:transcriptional regulator with XRE-family HTH domain|nr:helix-turn-helix transcriptional regulator [Thermoguttaceae bacterium]MDD4787041.1 helix-turn-helix transcriptional regulator [Pirellulales bacterium]MDI9442670.1 helix-turn-helix transcriptional regulator [Planctomycetota bacterium]NLZ02990.1 helix-turn-helix transcriptional regulator [Pirellulaceae bacterium]